MQKITPFLWFENNAEEAVNFYSSVFKDSKIGNMTRMPEGTPGPAGQVITGTFTLNNQDFMFLNGGPAGFKFNESISFFVQCKNQEEVDYYWEKLGENQKGQCGWIKDKFGLSWQIVPDALGELMGDKDPKKAQAVMKAMMPMGKIEVAKLQEAYDNA